MFGWYWENSACLTGDVKQVAKLAESFNQFVDSEASACSIDLDPIVVVEDSVDVFGTLVSIPQMVALERVELRKEILSVPLIYVDGGTLFIEGRPTDLSKIFESIVPGAAEREAGAVGECRMIWQYRDIDYLNFPEWFDKYSFEVSIAIFHGDGQ